MSDANTILMQSIRSKWGQTIAAACHTSSVPEAFLAALVANESGGNPNARRFEKSVLASLWEVLQGRAPAYGSIKRDDILAYIAVPPARAGAASAPDVRPIVSAALQQLDSLANSWGLTQVMGYEAIAFGERGFWADPDAGLRLSLKMLAQFAERYQLDLGKDFSEMFDCWNTGRPHGSPTFDPQYIPNGLARMAIYANPEQETNNA